MESLPDQLVRIRKARGLTQTEVAKRAGMSCPVLSRIERGRKEPRISEVIRITEVLGVRLALLRSDEITESEALRLEVPNEYRERLAAYLERQAQEVREGV